MGDPGAAYRPFAAWLRARMRERRLGQNQLAGYLGIGHSAVSEYLRARRRPRLETLRKIADYFAVDLATVEALLPTEPSDEAGDGARNGSVARALSVVSELTEPTLRLDLFDLTMLVRKGLSPDEARQLHDALQEVKERFGLR